MPLRIQWTEEKNTFLKRLYPHILNLDNVSFS